MPVVPFNLFSNSAKTVKSGLMALADFDTPPLEHMAFMVKVPVYTIFFDQKEFYSHRDTWRFKRVCHCLEKGSSGLDASVGVRLNHC
ncbi:hypothetical protein RO3G_08896 [Rhizopus delemar RA 99-880]|uniref:Uncharacterized protein n=1 Tax=Rhizopus delemar (strain RA 99-880 / ATCC MYA-4621 / FGSC 9543 / NRRL 43880) TaxID=246409 RepID=I1C6V6_RHIO9|nr:hypothetical protein RO3G_08896 [Rhizopus delemar RA 99-880]|eukprot:EIE84186.1 hypothetical protein RO3G_08896 [Rhizopus delemar RA 99-880]